MSHLLAFTPFGFSTPLPVIVLGAIVGMTYGLLAVGLVLVYRSSGIINFAHAEIGAFGAAVFATLISRYDFPYYAALPIAFAVAAGVGALTELAVIRRLHNAPRFMSIVATLGVGQFLVFFGAAVSSGNETGFRYPSPPGLPEYQFGALRLTQPYMGMLIFGPIVVVALTLFLRHSSLGVAIRCAAANPEAARMSGISANRMSALVWGLAGMLSVFTAILVLPSVGFNSGQIFGPSLLMLALAGAVIARMESMPRALAAGVGIGIIEQLLRWNYQGGGLVQLVLFVVILGSLLLQRGVGDRERTRGSWTAVQGWRPLPDQVSNLRSVRLIPWVVGGVGLAIGLLLPIVMTNSAAVDMTTIMCLSIVGVSVGVITGLGGELSLGQFGVAAAGAIVSFQIASRGGGFLQALSSQASRALVSPSSLACRPCESRGSC